MPDTEDPQPPGFTASGQPTLQQLVDYLVAQLTDPATLKKLEDMHSNAGARSGAVVGGIAEKTVIPALRAFAIPVMKVIGEILLAVLNVGEPVIDEISKFGVDAALGERRRVGAVADDVGAHIIAKLSPPGGAVEPGIGGAQQYLTAITHLQFETWAMGLVAELFADAGDLMRGAGMSLHSVAELREIATQVFGGGRITRRVLSPFIDDGIVTPAKWHTSKQYRPTLHDKSTLIEQFFRHADARAQLNEELARQGYSDERIEQLVENARPMIGDADVELLYEAGVIDAGVVTDHFKRKGHTEDDAHARLNAFTARLARSAQDKIDSIAIGAYADRTIEDVELDRLTASNYRSPSELAFVRLVAQTRRTLNVNRISASRMRQLVKDGIAAMPDYRRTLEREGYPLDDAELEELSLRVEMQKIRDVEKAKEQQAAEREREQQEADAARAQRQLELAEAKALPSQAEFTRAYVHGFIDRAALADAVAREHPHITPDNLAFVLDEADRDRADYLEQLAKRQAALNKPAASKLSVAALEQAVLAGVLTLSEFDAALARNEWDDSDRRVVTALLTVRLADAAAAEAQRKATAARAAERQIDLGAFERAVRLGVRTPAQYAAIVDTLVDNPVQKALLVDLLGKQLQIDDDARKKRAAADAAAAKRGIALDTRRRAVLAGVRPRAYYEAALIDAGLPVDDQLVELQLLDLELANAASARQRQAAIAAQQQLAAELRALPSLAETARAFIAGDVSQGVLEAAIAREHPDIAAADLAFLVAGYARQRAAAQQGKPEAPPPTVTLGQVQSAVVLGLIPPDDFRAYLVAQGYGADDVELLVALATARMPNVRAGQQLERQVEKESKPRAAALADRQRAVRRGLRDLDWFREQLSADGYGADAIELLVALLQEQLGVDVAALRRKIDAVLAKTEEAPALEELEAAADDGTLTGDELQNVLEQFGVAVDDALVFVRTRDLVEA